MKRSHRNLLMLVLLVGLWLVAPQVAYADNCSSLGDCYYTLRAALAAAVGLGVFAAFMAIGLDIGPLADRLKSRFKGMTGPDPVPDEEAAWWERSLGVLSLEGTVAGEATEAARAAQEAAGKREAARAPEQADRREQASPPEQAARSEPMAERMEQATDPPAEQMPVETRAGDRGRQATQEAGSGREAERVPGAADDAEMPPDVPDTGAVSERAEDVAQSLEGAGDTVEQAGSEPASKGARPSKSLSTENQAAAPSEQGHPAETPEKVGRQGQAEEAAADTARPSEQTQHESRTADRGRGEGEAAEAGRSGAWEGDVDLSGGQGADSGDVADRAQDVAEAFDSSQTEEAARSSQEVAGKTQAPEQARRPSSQARSPDDAAQESMAQAEPPSEQSSRLSEGVAGETPDAGAVRGKYSRQAEQIAGTFGRDAADDVLRTVEAVAHVGGTDRMLAGLASASPAALQGLLAELGTMAQLAGQGATVERAADVVHGRRAADLLIKDGPVVEVKDYYWSNPALQDEARITDVTRRLVRQAEWLRRRYPDRSLQFAFADLQGAPRQVSFVLDRIGVDVVKASRVREARRPGLSSGTYGEAVRAMTAQQYWGGLSASGWLDEISSRQQAGLWERVQYAFAHDARDAWLALADVVIDGESVYELNPAGESYHAHVVTLSERSDGLFEPTNIGNREGEGTITISFDHAGRRFEFDAAADSDYVDEGLIDLVNGALAHRGTSRRFVSLPAVDQMMHLALVSEESVRRAVDLNLIPELPAQT